MSRNLMLGVLAAPSMLLLPQVIPACSSSVILLAMLAMVSRLAPMSTTLALADVMLPNTVKLPNSTPSPENWKLRPDMSRNAASPVMLALPAMAILLSTLMLPTDKPALASV